MISTTTMRLGSLVLALVFALAACSDGPTFPGDQDGNIQVTGALNLNFDMEVVQVMESAGQQGFLPFVIIQMTTKEDSPDHGVLVVHCATMAKPGLYDVVEVFEETDLESEECMAYLIPSTGGLPRTFVTTGGTVGIESRTETQVAASLDFNAREFDMEGERWHPSGATVRVRGPISWRLDGN